MHAAPADGPLTRPWPRPLSQGHAGPVSAVAFSAPGDAVASLSARDGTLRFWRASSAGLFGGLWSLHSSCTRVVKLEERVVGSVRLDWAGSRVCVNSDSVVLELRVE